MPTFLANEALVDSMLVYLLISLRFLALLLTSSVFMLPSIPNTLRFWLSLALAVIVAPSVNIDIPMVLLGSWPAIFIMAGREFVVGAAIGLISSLPLYAMQISGFIDSTIIGFNMMNVMDPTSATQTAVLGQMKYMLAIWFYLKWNGHMLLVQALAESVRLVPLGLGVWEGVDSIPWLDWIQRAFMIALRISLPVIGSVLLAEVGLGFVARTVPQMNVFILGIPLKICIGLIVLLMILPSAVDIFHDEIEGAVSWALEGIHFLR